MEISAFIESFLFHEDNKIYWSPSHFGLSYKEFTFGNAPLHGWVVEGLPSLSTRVQTNTKHSPIISIKKIKGTILFFHSAQFNMSYNLIQVAFLVEAGYRVILWDYAGCGLSAGSLSLESMREDVHRLFLWLQAEHMEKNLILFGQGVGTFAALNFYRNYPSNTKAVILESPFANLKSWVKNRWGLVVGDIAAKLVKVDQVNQPEEIIPNIRVPLLAISHETGVKRHSNTQSLG